ncbi:hypothetical protein ABG067_008298, partial [Albugo candida]
MEGVVETGVAAQSSSSTTETTTTTLLYTPSNETKNKATKGKKKRKHESDDDSEGDDDADYAPSSSRKVVAGRSRIVFCSECKGRFARKIEDEDQTVCDNCLNGVTAANKKKPTPKRKIVSIKKDIIKTGTVPSLQDVCIAVVVDYIEDVESFGVISEESLEKISKIISRNRKLNDVTARLFMEPFKRRLDLYDCTGMNEVSLLNISQFCPRMEHLNLVYCGHITDNVVKAYANNLHFLKSLYVSGAFLVTKETWDEFFEKV